MSVYAATTWASYDELDSYLYHVMLYYGGNRV